MIMYSFMHSIHLSLNKQLWKIYTGEVKVIYAWGDICLFFAVNTYIKLSNLLLLSIN